MTRVLDGYHRVLKTALTGLMGVMIIPVSLQILSRYTDSIPRYIWTEEVARFCFVWLIMIGSIIAVRDRTHFDVDVLPQPKTRRREGIARLIVHSGMMLMAVAFAWYGLGFAKFGAIQASEMSGINMLSLYVSFPVAGVSWMLFLAEKMAADFRLLANDQPGSRE